MKVDFSQEMYVQILEKIIPFHDFLKLKVLELKEGYVKIQVPFQPILVGDPRIQRWHGGMMCTILDAACGASAFNLLTTPDSKIATLDLRVDFLKSSKPQDIVAEGWLIRKGANTVHAKAKTYHPGAEDVILAEAVSVLDIRGHRP